MKYLSILLLTFVTINIHAITISGKVTGAKLGEAVEFANVFLASTTYGTLTSTSGEFKLSVPRPGLYKLTVSHLAYKTYTFDVNVIDKDIADLVIKLDENTQELGAVSIKAVDPNRELNMKVFLERFFGNTRNSAKCQILNPGAIWFYYNPAKGYFKAFADSLIVIENKALGYIIRYKLEFFYLDGKECIFFGEPFFEDRIADFRNKKKIMERRRQAYYGSLTHFFKSLYVDSLSSNGFVINSMDEKPTIKDPSNKSTVNFGALSNPLFLSQKGNHLIQTNIPISNYNQYISTDSAVSNKKHLKTTAPFEIVYTHEDADRKFKEDPLFWAIKQKKGCQHTIARIRQGYDVAFYTNGAYSIGSFLTAGYMSWLRMGEMLPLNFDPDEKVEN